MVCERIIENLMDKTQNVTVNKSIMGGAKL